jgi:hypothetical protein
MVWPWYHKACKIHFHVEGEGRYPYRKEAWDPPDHDVKFRIWWEDNACRSICPCLTWSAPQGFSMRLCSIGSSSLSIPS